MNTNDSYCDLEEAALRLYQSPERVSQWCSEGKLPGVWQRLEDRAWLVPASSIDDWIKKHPFSRARVEQWLPGIRVLNRKYLGIPRVTLWGGLGFLVALIGLVSALYQFGVFQSPGPMTGDFRVAVAEFEVIGNRDNRAIGEELAQGVYLRMVQTIEELPLDFTVEIWGPDKVGRVGGEGREERAKDAAGIAERIRSDIVVYGLVDASRPIWTLTPEFFVTDQTLTDAQEITGQHEMGAPFEAAGQGNIATRIDVSTELGRRARLISMVAVGLAYYTARNYPEAQSILEQAEGEFDWPEIGGKEVLYLLIGNAAGKRGDLDAAEQAFRNALGESPEYSRAYAGLGSVFYIRALEPAEQTGDLTRIDVELVNQSIAAYENAAAASVRPALSDIPAKVHFGLGQAHLALHLQDSSKPTAPAIDEFQIVIEEYGDGANPRIRELAAESHARLGLIYGMRGDADMAVSQYNLAISLLYDAPDRQRLFEERVQELQRTAKE